VKSDGFDDLDRQLLQALQIDGRLPFSRIAEVLGVSDQTVARRYARLRSKGQVRVIGQTDAQVLGEVQWLVRVQCTPDAAAKVAQALALREDTSWISLTSGGTEISCMSRSRVGPDAHTLLLQRLPRTPSVVGVTAQCVLHTFLGGSRGLATKSNALTAEQARALQPDPPPAAAEGRSGLPVVFDDGDRRLLAALGRDGRAEVSDLAEATGWSPSTVRRRMAQLRDCGALYTDLDYDHRILNLEARAILWLSVAPAQLVEIGEAMAEHPEVAYACATTGATNLHAVVLCTDIHALYTYLTTRIAALPAVHQVETAPIMRTLKSAGSLASQAPGTRPRF
jgi:DNA-binding Lrp family transcriptional regulator